MLSDELNYVSVILPFSVFNRIVLYNCTVPFYIALKAYHFLLHSIILYFPVLLLNVPCFPLYYCLMVVIVILFSVVVFCIILGPTVRRCPIVFCGSVLYNPWTHSP